MAGKKLVPNEYKRMLEKAQEDKFLSPESAQIEVDFEVDWEEIKPSEVIVRENDVVLVAVLLDDSYSIEEFNNTENVIKGHNSIIDSLRVSRNKNQIIFRSQLLKSPEPINNWVELDDAKGLDKYNYQPAGETPLYDGTVKLLLSTVAKMEQVIDAKKHPRFSALILTDGEHFIKDESKDLEEKKLRRVKKLVMDIFKENDPSFPNTLAFMGLKNDRVQSYHKIANSMGIEDTRINSRRERVM